MSFDALLFAFWPELTSRADMTLVMLGCLPFMAIIRVLLSRNIRRMTVRAEESYSRASGIAQQVLSQIRTVVSYGGEEKALAQYSQQLVDPAKVCCNFFVLVRTWGTCFRGGQKQVAATEGYWPHRLCYATTWYPWEHRYRGWRATNCTRTNIFSVGRLD